MPVLLNLPPKYYSLRGATALPDPGKEQTKDREPDDMSARVCEIGEEGRYQFLVFPFLAQHWTPAICHSAGAQPASDLPALLRQTRHERAPHITAQDRARIIFHKSSSLMSKIFRNTE